jgi:hypothetical protein
MSFVDVESRTVIEGFSPTDKAMILAALKTIYEGSAIGKTMIDRSSKKTEK